MNEAHDTANPKRPGLLVSRFALLAMAALFSLSIAASPALAQGSSSGREDPWSTGGQGTTIAEDSSEDPEGSSEDSGEGSDGDSGYTADELEMVQAINDYRAQNGLEALKVSDAASTAAANHSSDMASYDFFSHDTKDSDTYQPGASFAERLDAEGYKADRRSENIAAGYEDVQSTLDQWKNSPGHDANMLREDLAVIGIGKECLEDSQWGCYWTTDFGSDVPEDARAVEEIEPSDEGSSSGDSSGQDPGSDDSTSEDASAEEAAEQNASSGDSSSGDSGSSGEDDAQIEVVEAQNEGEDGSSTNGSSPGSDRRGQQNTQEANQTQQSNKAVQITENGQTRTFTGDEASEQICEQFGQQREQIIGDLREDASSGSGGDGQDPAAAIKNDIADDFEQSLLLTEDCGNGGGPNGGSANDSSGGAADSSWDTSNEEPSSKEPASDETSSEDQYAEGTGEQSTTPSSDQDSGGENAPASSTQSEGGGSTDGSTGEDSTGEDSTGETSGEESSGADQYAEGTGEQSNTDDSANGDESATEEGATEEGATEESTTEDSAQQEMGSSGDPRESSTDQGSRGEGSGGEASENEASENEASENEASENEASENEASENEDTTGGSGEEGGIINNIAVFFSGE